MYSWFVLAWKEVNGVVYADVRYFDRLQDAIYFKRSLNGYRFKFSASFKDTSLNHD